MTDHQFSPDDWDKRTDVPQRGTSHLQLPIYELIPERKDDPRLLSAFVLIEFVGQPPNMHGRGIYRIMKCLGFEHLEGCFYAFGYNSVQEKKDL